MQPASLGCSLQEVGRGELCLSVRRVDKMKGRGVGDGNLCYTAELTYE